MLNLDRFVGVVNIRDLNNFGWAIVIFIIIVAVKEEVIILVGVW